MEQRKYTYRPSGDKKKIENRINRIEGQVKGIKKMIEEDRYCDDILIQLAAVDKSVKSLARVILENHMYTCITERFEKGELDVIDEVVELFRRFE